MEWLFWVGAWYACGLVGWTWALIDAHVDGDSTTLKDILLGLPIALSGPIIVIAMIGSGINYNRVLIRGRRA